MTNNPFNLLGKLPITDRHFYYQFSDDVIKLSPTELEDHRGIFLFEQDPNIVFSYGYHLKSKKLLYKAADLGCRDAIYMLSFCDADFSEYLQGIMEQGHPALQRYAHRLLFLDTRDPRCLYKGAELGSYYCINQLLIDSRYRETIISWLKDNLSKLTNKVLHKLYFYHYGDLKTILPADDSLGFGEEYHYRNDRYPFLSGRHLSQVMNGPCSEDFKYNRMSEYCEKFCRSWVDDWGVRKIRFNKEAFQYGAQILGNLQRYHDYLPDQDPHETKSDSPYYLKFYLKIFIERLAVQEKYISNIFLEYFQVANRLTNGSLQQSLLYLVISLVCQRTNEILGVSLDITDPFANLHKAKVDDDELTE